MGSVVSYLKKPKKILIIGPRCSGKTTVFERIAAHYKVKPRIDPKCQFNFLKVKTYNVWDLRCRVEYLQYYCDNLSCVMFVYDAENEDESIIMLRDLCLSKELRNSVLLVCINKVQDEHYAKKMEERIHKILKRIVFSTFVNYRGGDFSGIKESFEAMVQSSGVRKKY